METAILSIIFLSGLVNACHLNPDISITSLNLEALSGSCLLIPCNFRVKEGLHFPGRKNAYAVWIKTQPQFVFPNSDYVVFNSSRTTTNSPFKITGDLSQRNCTTVFSNVKSKYTDRFFFRVEDGDFKATAYCNSINITVRDSPWTPSITEQKDKEVVTITCSAVTPCPLSPPKLTWDKQQDTVNVIETNSDGTLTTTIKWTPTKSYIGDLTCSAAYPVTGGQFKTAERTIPLNVTFTYTGNEASVMDGIGVYNILKICGILLLYISLVFIKCWFRPSYDNKRVQMTKERDYVNCVIESPD